jgi:DNA-binding protein Fis
MVRTQIQLTEAQIKTLHDLALKQGVSVAELIRKSVDNYLKQIDGGDKLELIERAKEAAGKYHTDLRDLAKNHDRYLAEDLQK